jgi:hypothetical protein
MANTKAVDTSTHVVSPVSIFGGAGTAAAGASGAAATGADAAGTPTSWANPSVVPAIRARQARTGSIAVMRRHSCFIIASFLLAQNR